MVYSISVQTLDKLKSKSNHVRMLLKLYFQKSSGICDELDKFEKMFYEGMKLAYSAPEEFNKPEHKELILDTSVLYFNTLVNIRNFLQKEMKKLTSN